VRHFIYFLTLALWLFATEACAEFQVVSSTVPAYPLGKRLPDEAILDIPEGKRINLRHLENKRTYTIFGPFHGKLRDYKGGAKPRSGNEWGGSMMRPPPQR